MSLYTHNEGIDKYTRNMRKFSSASTSSDLSNQCNKGYIAHKIWSKLLKQLTEKFKSDYVEVISLKIISSNTMNDRRIWTATHSGLYSTHVLQELQNQGMTICNIIKAMKFGLTNLNHCELVYYKNYKVEPCILESNKIWTSKFSDELISNLRLTGLSECKCWHIIMHGIKVQHSNVLYRLMLSGIDIPEILNWKCSVHFASPKVIQFLSHIGIEKSVIQLVEQYGIDDVTEQMLMDLELCETKKKSADTKEIVCECSVPLLKLNSSSSETIQDIYKTSSLKNTCSFCDISSCIHLFTCQCHLETEKTIVNELTTKRNYLRQNVMVPLTWAMTRTLKYKPSDIIHYMAYQLLHWMYDNVTQSTKDTTQEFIAVTTTGMDHKLIIKRCLKEEQIRGMGQDFVKDVSCSFCKDYKKLHNTYEK